MSEFDAPTTEQLAASIGCKPEQIIRSTVNQLKTKMAYTEEDPRQIWTSFVDEGDPLNASVYETVWPQ